MSWTCPSCGKTSPVPPKWCGCEPYPITAEELAGVVECYLATDDGPRPIDEPAFEALVKEHQLVLRSGDPVPPALVRRVTTSGIEVAVDQQHEWASLSPELADAIARALGSR